MDLINSQSFTNRIYGAALDSLGALLRKALNCDSKQQVIAANSQYTLSMTRHFLKTQDKRTCVLYPPVDARKIMGKISWKAKRQNIVVTISRISPEKNLLIIPEIAKELVDIKFVLVGRKRDAKCFESLLRKIKVNGVSNVEILTNATEKTKMEVLQSAKVYLHTMPYEQFGISIVEGMAAGLTPVAHDSGGPKEFVTRNQRYKEPSDLIEKIYDSLHSWNRKVASQNTVDALKFDQAVFDSKASELINSLF
jgi:alpha-1,2-mannosyltransferase